MSATRVSFLGASPDAVLRSPACKGQSEATPPQSISTPDHAFYSSSKRQSRSCGVIHKLSCRRTAVRSCHPQDQQNRLLQNGSWAADNNLTFGQALKRSVCSLGVALSVHLPSTSTALALDSDILGGANNIIRDLEVRRWCLRALSVHASLLTYYAFSDPSDCIDFTAVGCCSLEEVSHTL